ncbi:diguanylate cyclase [Roseomonas sp. E05]|uniref:GGDEF domain-containing protein n=1 Tax=Roseomonas sp. E05 TaxID=3046310 RepID=UPI0024B90D5F|nr:diguanylate cyclase [Roseomonas sp. E05]MDJ0387528.1 diguanylate cyclase [Roseomonas sp. E05]
MSATVPVSLPAPARVGRLGRLWPQPDAAWCPGWCRAGGARLWLGLNLAVMLGYLGLGCAVGRFFAAYGLFPSPIWLPAGLAAVAAMLGGWRLAPGLFAGSFLVNAIAFGSRPELAALISLGNMLGPLAGATLTRRFRPATGLFTRFGGVIAFLAGAVLLHAGLTAMGGTLAMWLLGDAPPQALPGIFSGWLLCDAGGTFYFAPSLALWLGVERTPSAPQGAGLRLLDGSVWLGTALLALVVFELDLPPRLPSAQLVFLLAVPLSWIALRISLRAAYSLLTLLCVIASAGTVAGHGPFQGEAVDNPMQSVGLLIVLCGMNILTLLALVSERREAELALAEANHLLERRVAERTAELRRLADTDALTGLANRRSFLAQAQAALQRAAGAGRPFALLAFDLDHFKAINDGAGHAGGDLVLRRVAECCMARLRRQDLLGRLGGEEFAIALPETDFAEAEHIAERMRAVLASIRLPAGAPAEHLSASFGLALARAGEARLEDLLRRADAALYAAKHAGRDQVRVAG